MLSRKFRRPPSFGDIYELRVTLQQIEPGIWRRLRVPAELPLGTIHDILQVAFDWKNCHLHDFTASDIRFGMVDVEDEMFSVDEHAAPLGAIAQEGSTFTYRYDFGDDWEHEIVVERILEKVSGPDIACTGGARAGPPEDCGGSPGYQRMLEILANPKDEEHADMRAWVGKRYDPEAFDVAAVNKKLATLAKRFGRRL